MRVLLAVADPEAFAETRRYFEAKGHLIETARGAEESGAALNNQVFDLCLLDAGLGTNRLPELVGEFNELSPWTAIIVLTDSESAELAEAALDAGAADYFHLPCTPMHLHIAACKHLQLRHAESRLECLINELGPRLAVEHGLQSESPAMMKVLETAQQVAQTDATVLIVGESGTGKSVLARAIHLCSDRSNEELVTVSCPALSAGLLESELFGHRKGAFTGAVANNPGRVSQAEGGTLFLDEVGDVPLEMQPKLLRFVQDREFERVGDPTTRKADVRLIAATNQDLAWMVETKRFREDLYYRLNVVSLEIPPLRERREDIVPLARLFIERFSRAHGKAAVELSSEGEEALRDYGWPGNIRELLNLMERLVILGNGAKIGARQLKLSDSRSWPEENGLRPGQPISLKEMEKAHIEAVIDGAESLEAAARILGIHPSTLWRKRRQYGI
jgi:NtrC-family two-component system response regulator AlgB